MNLAACGCFLPLAALFPNARLCISILRFAEAVRRSEAGKRALTLVEMSAQRHRFEIPVFVCLILIGAIRKLSAGAHAEKSRATALGQPKNSAGQRGYRRILRAMDQFYLTKELKRGYVRPQAVFRLPSDKELLREQIYRF